MNKTCLILLVALFMPIYAISSNCVDFDTLAVGDRYGDTINMPGDIVFSQDDIDVSVVEFYWDALTTNFGNAEVVSAFPDFGNGNVLAVNNLNILFDFTALGGRGYFTFEFADYGGFENLEVNGHQIFIQEMSFNAPGNPAPGVNLYISTIESPHGFLKSRVLLYGNVQTLLLGGQEFYLDKICSPTGGGGSLNKYCVDFETLSVGDRFGDTINLPNDWVFDQNYIDVLVHNFFWDPATTHFGNCEVTNAPPDFGTSQVMNFNNVNLGFDFNHFGNVNRVQFDFADHGGFENLEVNGHPTPYFIGELNMVPGNIAPGVHYYISRVTNGHTKASVILFGDVNNMVIGGQEFMLDNVCAYTLFTDVDDDPTYRTEVPHNFILKQNTPNPFNPGTAIQFELYKPSKVVISIFNTLGEEIRILTNTYYQPGTHKVYWNGKDDYGKIVSSGIYFYRMKTEHDSQIRKMSFIR